MKPGSGLLEDLRSAWPPVQRFRNDGYLTRSLADTHVVDALALRLANGGLGAVAVIEDERGDIAALPCIRLGRSWYVAAAGGGLAAAFLAELRDVHAGSASGQRGAFELSAMHAIPEGADERSLGTDQTNLSVVVGERVLAKWRTAFDADGHRAVTLRRHLDEVGFIETPRLLGALSWRDQQGRVTVLADVDAYLDDAEDGWERFIGDLAEHVDARHDCGPSCPASFAADLGALTARLHLALRQPSSIIPEPVHATAQATIQRWHLEALATLNQAGATDATDRIVIDRMRRLRTDIDGLVGIPETTTQPVHGDLHIGQIVPWADGLALSDFDGPPGRRATQVLDRQATARDVAQMLGSLDQLAVVVVRRAQLASDEALQGWAAGARASYLSAYRAEFASRAEQAALDERLLRPFIAAQLCRELLYAHAVLPRWRYATVGALRWQYP